MADDNRRLYDDCMTETDKLVIDIDRHGPDFATLLQEEGKTPEMFEDEVLVAVRTWCRRYRDAFRLCLLWLHTSEESNEKHIACVAIRPYTLMKRSAPSYPWNWISATWDGKKYTRATALSVRMSMQ